MVFLNSSLGEVVDFGALMSEKVRFRLLDWRTEKKSYSSIKNYFIYRYPAGKMN